MLVSGTISVNDSTPTLLVDGPAFGEYVAHLEVANPVVIGDSGVTTGSGLLLVPGSNNAESIFTVRIQGESLYAVSVGVGSSVGVLAYSA